jgi:hypothetical protein
MQTTTISSADPIYAALNSRAVSDAARVLVQVCNDNFHVRVASTTMTGFFVWA